MNHGTKNDEGCRLAGPKQIEVREEPVPELKSGEIEIRVSACGV